MIVTTSARFVQVTLETTSAQIVVLATKVGRGPAGTVVSAVGATVVATGRDVAGVLVSVSPPQEARTRPRLAIRAPVVR